MQDYYKGLSLWHYLQVLPSLFYNWFDEEEGQEGGEEIAERALFASYSSIWSSFKCTFLANVQGNTTERKPWYLFLLFFFKWFYVEN